MGKGFYTWNNTSAFEVSGAHSTAREKLNHLFIVTPGRTHIRIRSPKLVVSGQQEKVGEGSRQDRFVTLGKALALEVGSGGPCRQRVR